MSQTRYTAFAFDISVDCLFQKTLLNVSLSTLERRISCRVGILIFFDPITLCWQKAIDIFESQFFKKALFFQKIGAKKCHFSKNRDSKVSITVFGSYFLKK